MSLWLSLTRISPAAPSPSRQRKVVLEFRTICKPFPLLSSRPTRVRLHYYTRNSLVIQPRLSPSSAPLTHPLPARPTMDRDSAAAPRRAPRVTARSSRFKDSSSLISPTIRTGRTPLFPPKHTPPRLPLSPSTTSPFFLLTPARSSLLFFRSLARILGFGALLVVSCAIQCVLNPSCARVVVWMRKAVRESSDVSAPPPPHSGHPSSLLSLTFAPFPYLHALAALHYLPCPSPPTNASPRLHARTSRHPNKPSVTAWLSSLPSQSIRSLTPATSLNRCSQLAPYKSLSSETPHHIAKPHLAPQQQHLRAQPTRARQEHHRLLLL